MASSRPVFGALITSLALLLTLPGGAAVAGGPAGWEHLHTYAENKQLLDDAVTAHPDIAARFSIGRSYEGRDIWAIKISDNVTQDEAEPEVFIDAQIHANERITNELALYLIDLLVDGYGVDSRITRIVDSREIFIVPMVNPDGAEYDISDGRLHSWRKNRQPIAGSSELGLDLNRQFGFMWNSGGKSSDNPASAYFHGTAPWQAPEVRAYRDFVNSRVINGRQQIRASVSIHSVGRMVLWPYSYTRLDLPPTMSRDDRRAFVALGQQMAALNGYRAAQGSDLYRVDGDQDDWQYHEHRIFAFTIELAALAQRHYPTATEVAATNARNRATFLLLFEQADCPYRAAGLAGADCGPLYDDFEADRGWRLTASGRGGFERALPARVASASGVKQRVATVSGQRDLVTGAAAGASAAANDLDGTTDALSPTFRLEGGAWQLTFRYTLAHDSASSGADYLRVSVVHGQDITPAWTVSGRPSERNAAWLGATIDLSAYAGRDIALLFEAADGGLDNLFEAAIDDVRVIAVP